MKIEKYLLLFLFLFSYHQINSEVKYIAYEGFDYPTNAPIDAQSGGTGWSNPWDVITGFKGGFLINSTPGSLSYLDLKSSGNYATGGFEWYAMGRRLNTSETGPFAAWVEPWEDGIGTKKTATTIYMSAILGKKNANNDEAYFDLHENTLAWYNYSTDLKRIGVGYFGAVSDVSGQKRWSLRIDNNLYDTGVPVVLGTPSFFVVKVEFGVSLTSVSVYINPTTIGANEPTPTIIKAATSRHCIRSMGVYLGAASNNGVIDEIRFGSSYESVAPNSTTVINLPPSASFTTSVSSGQAPLQVTFDASTSVDPEGKQLSYLWNFGDGSATGTGVTVTHTYSGLLGVIIPTLTVTDDAGSINSASNRTIKLTDANNTFPCFTTVQVVNMATCGNNDGDIKVTVPTASTVVLKNMSGLVMPQTATNANDTKEYKNLAPGQYDLFVTGDNACSDHRQLYIVTDSTTCSGWQANMCNMKIGTNLTSISDWTHERAFRNLMKNVREDFVPYFPTNGSIWSTDYPVNNWTTSQMSFDANGYPSYLPQNTSVGSVGLRYVISTDQANLLPNKRYVLLYDGVGTIEFPGVTILSNTTGRILFELSASSGTVSFNMSYSKQGDNVRNIRLLRQEDEFVDTNTNVFSPEFLDRIAPFAGLRFMEWSNVNGSPIAQWSQRNTTNRWTYFGAGGVPYEMIIKLANLTQKDVWINIPHLADDNFLTQMATLFRDQLDPKLKIYVEYSNELWNWTFSQSSWNDKNKPSNLSYGRAAAEKAKHALGVWTSVFGTQKSRMYRILGLQGGYTELSEDIMSELKNEDWDLASTSFYYSLDHADVGALANPVLTATSLAADIITNSRNKWNREKPMMKRLFNCAKLYGKQIIGYEGGQHFVGVTGGVTYPYTEAMYDSQTCPEMHGLYNDVLTDIRNLGCILAMNYSLAGNQRSIYGSWGALTDIGMTPPFYVSAPKYQALLDNIASPGSCTYATATTNPVSNVNNSLVYVYPNPTKNNITIKVNNSDNFIKAQLFDVMGKYIHETNLTTIDMNSQKAGIYFLKVFTSNGVNSVKIVKEN